MEDYINLVEVVPAGTKWEIWTHTKKGLKYLITTRVNKNNTKHIAIGLCLAIGYGHKERKQELELIVKNRKGIFRGKDSKSSFGYDNPKVKG